MMVEDTQFFRMRELAWDAASHQTEFNSEINSETWIDCAGQVNSNTLPLHPMRQHPKSLARYILKPLTGQRHQLRVHMNALGLPLINDQLYPHVLRGADEADDFNAPLQLLAKMIVFKDPISGDLREFETQFKL
jgi:tRNA pseudouridine32 synthase/23S rRNA pseudouridine746 synthase